MPFHDDSDDPDDPDPDLDHNDEDDGGGSGGVGDGRCLNLILRTKKIHPSLCCTAWGMHSFGINAPLCRAHKYIMGSKDSCWASGCMTFVEKGVGQPTDQPLI